MKPLVALAMPYRAIPGQDIEAYANGVANKANRSGEYEVMAGVEWKSLLPFTFNILWTGMLNARNLYGKNLTHFAMIHDDIVPEEGWLDKLLAILNESGADLVSAVVPIKDDRGLTSTGVDMPGGDVWGPKRLTLAEAFELPATFGDEHVGGNVVLNTGLWVCRFDRPWNERVQFRQQDRIVRLKDGRVCPQTISEDWDFSRQVRAGGGKLLATRAVELFHEDRRFHNRYPWGMWTNDMEYDVPQEAGSTLPDGVDGWLDPAEGRALAELAAGKRVLEIGSYCGLSTICMARTAAHVHAVDPFDGRGTPQPRSTFGDFWVNIKREGLANKVTTTIGTAAEVPADAGPFDLVFIDGAHDLDSVRADIAHARRLAPDALLAFHDYRDWPGQGDGRWDPGVTEAVRGLLEKGGRMVARHVTLAVVQPPAA